MTEALELGTKPLKTLRRNRIYEEQKKKIFDYFLTHPCVDCGERNPLRLTFDHVRGEKSLAVSRMICQYKWETIQAEIAKCDVRCANCHAVKTAVQFGHVPWFFEKYGEEALMPWASIDVLRNSVAESYGMEVSDFPHDIGMHASRDGASARIAYDGKERLYRDGKLVPETDEEKSVQRADERAEKLMNGREPTLEVLEDVYKELLVAEVLES